MGIRPTGFNKFKMTPRFPAGWNNLALRNIHSFGNIFDLEVLRLPGGKLSITVKQGDVLKKYTIKEGATQQIVL